ncbi:tetratricopeptide repeat-containing diguanylate cyclase [Dokdonella sp. MW10]|uniref:tetratricopeptide repeat-containing diguanylate cyclase n=1 Tax=Dokdonella sp. MW10 TaxID=2992926 RepID=UPI003F7F0679
MDTGRIAWRIVATLLATAAGTVVAQVKDQAGPHEATLKECTRIVRNDPNAAVPLAESVLAASPLLPDTEIRALVCLGQARATLGDPAAAAKIVTRVLERVDEQAVVKGEAAYALGQAGGILQTIGQSQRAAALYERSHALTREDGSPRAEMLALLNIAGLQSGALRNHEAAEPYFRRAIEISREIGAESSYMQFNYGLNLMLCKRPDDALRELARAVELADAAEGQQGVRHRAEAVRAEILMDRGDFAAAREALEPALAGQRALPDALGEATSLRRLARLQRLEGDTREALVTATRAVELARNGGYAEDEQTALRELAEVHRALGRFGEAMDVVEHRHAREIAALADQNLKSLAGMQADLENQSGARRVEKLEFDNRLQALEVERVTLLRNLAIGGLVLVLGGGLMLYRFQRDMNRRLLAMSTTDALTGLVNRRLGARRLADLAMPNGARNVVLLVDVDHFKEINDTHGHAAGDHVLVELARHLKALCRADDLVARWGGEEFLIACRQPDLAHARAFAERLRAGIAGRPIRLADGRSLSLSVSVGFAPFPFVPGRVDEDWHRVVALADRALYAVKRSGRDAWAGLWNAGNSHVALDAVERDPDGAAREGIVVLESSRPVAWSPEAAASGRD